MADLSEQIETTATDGVASATVDGRSATAVPIPDLIAADRYLAGKTAVEGTNPNGGKRSAWGKTRMARVVPPGAV